MTLGLLLTFLLAGLTVPGALPNILESESDVPESSPTTQTVDSSEEKSQESQSEERSPDMEVIITGKIPKRANPPPLSIQSEEMETIPGNVSDPLRALQNLPGAVTASDFMAGLYVRGGGPQDNVYLLDNMPLPYPFHFGGILSTLNQNAIDSAELYTGGFGARLGESTSAALEIRTRTPRLDRWTAETNLSMIFMDGYVEGPLGSKSSMFLAGRRSFYDLILPRLVDTPFTTFPAFADYQMKYWLQPTVHHQIIILLFGSWDKSSLLLQDDANFEIDRRIQGEYNFDSSGSIQGLKWTASFPSWKLDTTISRSTNFFNFEGHQLGDIGSRLSMATIREDFQWDYLPTQRLALGTESRWFFLPISGTFFAVTDEEQNDLQSLWGTFAKVKTDKTVTGFSQQFYIENTSSMIEEKITLSTGLRSQFLRANQERTYAPRISVLWKIVSGLNVFASWGKYFRSPEPKYVDSDIGNSNLVSEKALSYSAGMEIKKSGWSLRAETYRKYISQIIVSNAANRFLNSGEGQSYGIELLLRRRITKSISGWLAYTASRSLRRRDSLSALAPSDYDQPHVLTLVASHRLSSSWRWGLKWRHTTGNPFTPSLGPGYNFIQGWYPLPGLKNSGRLPDYHRLDLSLTYKKSFSRSVLSVTLQVLNFYNRKNIQAYIYDVSAVERLTIYQIPFLPYIGFGLSF